MRYAGKLYRELNPVHAREPLSGRGAQLYGGRFNPKGMPALYTSLSIMTALREANQVGTLQPTTLVAYEAEIDAVFDCRDAAGLAAMGMDAGDLADPGWREQMKTDGEARTQTFARRLVETGHNGLLMRSFAPGTADADMNLVLWKWGGRAPCRLTLIDEEGAVVTVRVTGRSRWPTSRPHPEERRACGASRRTRAALSAICAVRLV